jgi:hypothetical protein
VQRFGTTYEEHAGHLARIVDRTGHVWAELTWDGDVLVELRAPGAVVGCAAIDHGVLGAAVPITTPEGEPLTVMSAIRWVRPDAIPAIATPGRLPPGAGGVILNVLAVLARDRALRYAGPYPTSALYQSLLRSFRTSATEGEFTAGAIDRSLHGSRDALPFDFHPAPHERIAIPCGHVELRTALERAVIDGLAYARGGSPARLVGARAEVWFGDAPYAYVATLSEEGAMIDGPHPIPASTSAVVGKDFPRALREAIAELVAEAVPAPLAAAARALVATSPIRWADLGARAARREAGGFTVHAALWDRLSASGLARVALALTEALAPVVAVAVVADVGVMSPTTTEA